MLPQEFATFSENIELSRLLNDYQWKLRVEFHIIEDKPLTNRDLLSLAHVLDSIVRSITKSILFDLHEPLQLSQRNARVLNESFERLPAASLETGELIEFRKGNSWTLQIDVNAAAIIGLAYALLRVTLLKDIEASWSETKLSKYFRQALKANIPAIMHRTAMAVEKRLRQVGRLGFRMIYLRSEVNVEKENQVIRLYIEVRRSQIVAAKDTDLDLD